jgi:hypothetical protein
MPGAFHELLIELSSESRFSRLSASEQEFFLEQNEYPVIRPASDKEVAAVRFEARKKTP